MSVRLQAEALRVAYGRREVLRGAGFALRAGETAALLGLNAAGKTTLLRALCGLVPLKGGNCRVNGEPYLHLDERRRARLVSYMPQRPSRLYNLTVMDVVLMGFNPSLRLFSQPGQRERAAALAALRRLGMEARADEDFFFLSEGQKQLVLLARALVQDTELLLLDEPDSALDYPNRHLVLELLREIVRENGRAALLTLHDPNLALAYCDRLLTLRDGVIAQDVEVCGASAEELRACLSAVFGEVEVIESRGRFVMLSAKR